MDFLETVNNNSIFPRKVELIGDESLNYDSGISKLFRNENKENFVYSQKYEHLFSQRERSF